MFSSTRASRSRRAYIETYTVEESPHRRAYPGRTYLEHGRAMAIVWCKRFARNSFGRPRWNISSEHPSGTFRFEVPTGRRPNWAACKLTVVEVVLRLVFGVLSFELEVPSQKFWVKSSGSESWSLKSNFWLKSSGSKVWNSESKVPTDTQNEMCFVCLLRNAEDLTHLHSYIIAFTSQLDSPEMAGRTWKLFASTLGQSLWKVLVEKF